MERTIGFAPVFDEDSRVSILASFPSVRSRQIDFYYGNKQNCFWRTVCGFFGEEIPEMTEGKREFLKRRHKSHSKRDRELSYHDNAKEYLRSLKIKARY